MSLRSSAISMVALLVAGGLGYWYIQKYGCPEWLRQIAPWLCPNGSGTSCEAHTTQLDCLGAGCFWYNNSCHTQPQSYTCQGSCDLEGALDCTIGDDLCICQDGEWQLYQQNASECISGETHLECFPHNQGYVQCVPTPGYGTDTCWTPGYSAGCYCTPGYDCMWREACNLPYDSRCLLRGLGDLEYAEKEDNTHWLYLELDEPIIATMLTDAVAWYKDAGLVDVINWSLWAEYDGQDYKLKDGAYTSSGGTGWFYCPELPLTFSMQGIERIKLHMDSTLSSVNPRSWQGKFTY